MYAELASLAFRATGRQALTDHTMSTQFSAIHRSNTLSRLKLSEDSWQPLLKKKKNPPFGRAKSSATTVPQQPSPGLPEPIRRYVKSIMWILIIELLCLADRVSNGTPVGPPQAVVRCATLFLANCRCFAKKR